jgi:rod shape determining protein RodA
MGRAVQSFASRFDWVLLGLVLGLAAVGITNLYSSSVALKESLHIAQSIWLALGLGLAGLTVAFDYRTYERWAYVIYGAALLLLIAVFFVGATINNSRRWLDLGAFLLQPSELIKLAMIITAARFFADFPKNDGYSLWDLRWLFALLGVPALLIMMQPDLGTSLVVIFITMTMILFQGVTLRSLLTMITGVVVGAPLFWLFGLKEYQKERILSFMDLEKDSYGAGWQVRQSLIAFGSGGLGGRGFLQGTQVQKGFVPYHESDFAAVNWAEEHGFFGDDAAAGAVLRADRVGCACGAVRAGSVRDDAGHRGGGAAVLARLGEPWDGDGDAPGGGADAAAGLLRWELVHDDDAGAGAVDERLAAATCYVSICFCC